MSPDLLRVTILGCGSSGGVPRIGPDWGACDPANPKNRRRRCSLLVERIGPKGVTRVLVDASPDLREQLLDAQVGELDAVLITHEHADHTHGLDDLRQIALRTGRRVPVHMDEATSKIMHRRFGYCFERPPGSSYPPILEEHRLVAGRETIVEGQGGPITALPFEQRHGDILSLGLRFGRLAYSSDVSELDATAVAALEALDLWIVDALRERPHPSHFTVDEALSWIDRLRPRRAVLTNMHVDLDYETLRFRLPPGVEPAFDRMVIEVEARNSVREAAGTLARPPR